MQKEKEFIVTGISSPLTSESNLGVLFNYIERRQIQNE
jgi:hypothetical protein